MYKEVHQGTEPKRRAKTQSQTQPNKLVLQRVQRVKVLLRLLLRHLLLLLVLLVLLLLLALDRGHTHYVGVIWTDVGTSAGSDHWGMLDTALPAVLS